MAYQNFRKNTLTTKWMKAQGAEEAKLEPKGRMWGELMTRFFP